MNINVQRATEVLRSGGIVIFPTDTAFGIGCRIDDKKAVERLFEIRERPKDKAVPILCSSIRMVQEYVKDIDPDVRKLMDKYWPGALTLVLNCNMARVPLAVRGGGETVGIRIPDHDSVLKIIEEVGVPILGPSANFAGEKTPFELSDLDPDLIRQVEFILAGECKIKKPSTVLDVTKKPWKVVREGSVSLNKQISKVQISK